MIILMFTGKVLQLGSLLYLTSLTYIDFVPSYANDPFTEDGVLLHFIRRPAREGSSFG